MKEDLGGKDIDFDFPNAATTPFMVFGAQGEVAFLAETFHLLGYFLLFPAFHNAHIPELFGYAYGVVSGSHWRDGGETKRSHNIFHVSKVHFSPLFSYPIV